VALVPLVIAWAAQHTTPVGWIALLGALTIELLRWATVPAGAGSRPRQTALARSLPTSPPAGPAPSPEPVQEDAGVTHTSIALLRSVCELPPTVFHASLRRCGQRDAELIAGRAANGCAEAGEAAGRIRLRVGQSRLELVMRGAPYHADPAPDDTIAEARPVLPEHAACVVITSHDSSSVRAGEIARLHCRAITAIAEFAPVVASYWPVSGRVAALAELADWCADESPDAAKFLCGPGESGQARH
jgi:hypothetical protein